MAYLRKTSRAKILGLKAVKGFPLILDKNFQVHTLSLRFFLYYSDYVQVSSVATYAAHICDFISQLEVDEKDIATIDDDWLVEYKQAIIERDPCQGNNTQNYASQVCRSVISYCIWLTENNHAPFLCGPTKNHRIQVSYTESMKVKHPTIKNLNKDKRALQAPRTDWIQKIKPYGPQRSDLAMRFELMIDWGRLAGLRAKEICHLKLSNLPSRETAYKAHQNERMILVALTATKGNRPQSIRVAPALVLATWDYVEIYRALIIKKFAKIHKNDPDRSRYSEPNEIFLSDKTGKSINPISFSTSVRKAFLTAINNNDLTEDERVWTHGLRHNFITKSLRLADAAGQKHPERITMQSSRHNAIDSMEPYISDRYSEDFD